MGAVIEVDALTKRFGATLAVDGVSFAVPRGRITGLLGPNGSGKTTTLRVLLGLSRATSGRATIDGRPFAGLNRPAHEVGALLDGGQFHPGRTGRDHVRVFAAAAGVPRSRIGGLLERVGLADVADRRVGGYSLGMRQRLGLATAMLGEPHVLVLDEPANGLDPRGIRWLRDLLRGHRDAGGAVLLSSHGLAELQQVVDDVVVIDHGRVVAQGPIGDVVGPDGRTLEDVFLELTGGDAA